MKPTVGEMEPRSQAIEGTESRRKPMPAGLRPDSSRKTVCQPLGPGARDARIPKKKTSWINVPRVAGGG